MKMLDDLSTVIVANGTFPIRPDALALLKRAKYVVCCDGAVDKLTAAGFTPTAIVGDCDSMNTQDLVKWKHCLFPDKSQEYNDLQKALRYCMANGLKSALMLGCDGIRDDHFLANVSIMATYSDRMKLAMLTGHGVFNCISETAEFESEKGQQVSVFVKDEHLPISLHGLQYPVSRRCFSHLWEGSLNEALSDTFTVELHAPGTVLVYRELRG